MAEIAGMSFPRASWILGLVLVLLLNGPPAAAEEPPDLSSRCSKGDWTSCVAFAESLEESDPAAAVKAFRRACDRGHAPACDGLGRLVASGNGIDPDDARAVKLFRKACEGKFAGGCLHLGEMYFDGFGVDQNPKAMVAAYEKACDLGAAEGCTRAAAIFSGGGLGLGRDPVKAAKLAAKACANGDADQCNVDDANALLQKQCDDGKGSACDRLGFRFAGHEGVTRNVEKMLKVYTRACELGQGESCFALAESHDRTVLRGSDADGLIVNDQVAAQRYYSRACELGDRRGCDRAPRGGR